MSRAESIELTVGCALYHEGKILLQQSRYASWSGLCLPGGHVEKGESFVEAVIREMREETGLTIQNPQLCGIKQFPNNGGERYIVLLFRADSFEGTLTSSAEGKNDWYRREDLPKLTLVEDLLDQLEVMESPTLTEFQQVERNGEWINIKR